MKKSHQYHLPHISSLCHSAIFTALFEVITIFHLDCQNSFLSGLLATLLGSYSILFSKPLIFKKIYKLDHVTSCFPLLFARLRMIWLLHVPWFSRVTLSLHVPHASHLRHYPTLCFGLVSNWVISISTQLICSVFHIKDRLKLLALVGIRIVCSNKNQSKTK